MTFILNPLTFKEMIAIRQNHSFAAVILNKMDSDRYGAEQYPFYDVLEMAYYNLIDIRETKGLDIIHPCVEIIWDE